jgi:hypothetical protein
MSCAVVGSAVEGQQVTGRLLDSSTRAPIVLGTVALLDTTMTVIDQTFTTETGSFTLTAPRPGAYFVLATRVGYLRAVDGILDLGAGGSINVDFFLRPQPLLLDSLVVEARRQRTERHLADQGFYQRMKAGFGHFITPEKIERRPPFDGVDLLRGIPGVRATRSMLGTSVRFSGGRGGTCTPAMYIDGARVQAETLEEVVDVNDIAAVELYTRASSTPLEWGGVMSACGTLLIWTKHGEPSSRGRDS